MPRIDPEQLLKCLSVLLSTNGGIKSVDEVMRLVTLMMRFSKKLVSKCIYLNILKSTETEILGSFMTAGGWSMTLGWLHDGIVAQNWPLVEEILKLLFLCPVDVERLKSNTFPRKVKVLSKDPSHPSVQYLATCLVDRWLKVVKGETVQPLLVSEIPVYSENSDMTILSNIVSHGNELSEDNIKDDFKNNSDKLLDSINKIEASDINISENKVNDTIVSEESSVSQKSDNKSKIDDDKSEQIKKSEQTKKNESISKKSSHSSKSLSDKHERRSSSSSRSSSSHHRSSRDHSKRDSKDKKDDSSRKHSSSSKDKERDKDKSSHKHKDKHKSSESKSHSEDSKSKDKHSSSKSGEKQSSKLQTVSISELGKIPKKKHHDNESSDVKKHKNSISIEVRQSADANRPKTVKTFNSKFRSHGLEEEAKPPPPRGHAKKQPTTTAPTISKRLSPIPKTDAPPEKKQKISQIVDKPGAIKLIPPKPKPAFLQESDMFMDALTASATNKKEPKKKKRKLSISKETLDSSPPTSPNTSNTTQSPTSLPKSAPFRFYQDTLDSEDTKEVKDEIKQDITTNDVSKKDSDKDSDNITMKSPLMSPPRKIKEEETVNISIEPPQIDIQVDVNTETDNGLKSILSIAKIKGPKKSLRWRDTNLEEVQYFELDENERVNVTRTFLDMKQMERIHEREAFQKARNLINDDLMGEQTSWRALILIDAPEIEYGKKSNEKNVQMARQKTVLQCLYLNKGMIPDTAAEPDNEQHHVTDPVIIPLEDLSGSDHIEDMSDRPWPEPKSYGPPPTGQGINAPPNMYNPMPSFGPGFQNSSMPGTVFPPNNGVMPGDWPMNGPNMMMPNGPPEVFMGPNGCPPMFQPPIGTEFPMMDNMNGPMFPQGFPGPMGNMMPNGPMMNRPMGPNAASFNSFPNSRGNNNRGSSRGSWRGKGNWNGPPRGGGNNITRGNTKRCIHFQKKGYCRQENNCHFAHY